MHRQILKVPDDMFVDHINRNSLDNRKANLRPATPSQNVRNRAKNTNRTYTSKYKGVTWNRCIKPWRAHIHFNHKLISLGSFDDEIRAAKAYDRAARRYHGEFAVLNFPEPKRPVARIVPFIAGVLLTYLAYLFIWPDRQTELKNIYQQLTNIAKLTDFYYLSVYLRAGSEPFVANEDWLRKKKSALRHPERSEGSRLWQLYSNASVD